MLRRRIALMCLLLAWWNCEAAESPFGDTQQRSVVRDIAVFGKLDDRLLESPKQFMPHIRDASVPLQVRFYAAVRMLKSKSLTSDEIFDLVGFIYATLVDNSPVDAGTVLTAFWRSLPNYVTDEDLVRRMRAADWAVDERVFAGLISGKTRNGQPLDLDALIALPEFLR